MANSCLVIKKNLGKSQCNVMPGQLKAFIKTSANFLLSAADSIDSTKWQDALFNTPALRIHLFPKFKRFKNDSEADVYSKNELAALFVRYGRYEFLVEFIESFYFHKALQSHASNGDERIFLVDANNRIWGMTDEDDNFKGYSLEMVQPEKMNINDGKEPSTSPLRVTLADSTELNVNGAWVEAQSFYSSLLELVDVDLAQVGVSGTDSLVKFTVKASADGVSVDGLAVGDIVVKSSDGLTTRALTGLTQDDDGVYSVTSAAAFVDNDTINLVAAADLTVPGYESTGKVVLNIV